MSSAKYALPGFECDDTLDTPIVLKGVEGVDYDIIRCYVKDSSELFIGATCKAVTGTSFQIDLCGDLDTAFLGQVADTIWNKVKLQEQNPNTLLTHSLKFTSGTYVDVIVSRGTTITKMLLAANNAIEIGSRIGTYTAGDVKLWATTAGAFFGRSRARVSTGAGTQWIPVAW